MGKPLDVEKLTVAELEELNLFSYGPEIQEVVYNHRISVYFAMLGQL